MKRTFGKKGLLRSLRADERSFRHHFSAAEDFDLNPTNIVAILVTVKFRTLPISFRYFMSNFEVAAETKAIFYHKEN